MTRGVISALALLIGAATAHAGGVEIVKGRLTNKDQIPVQLVTATNNTGKMIEYLNIACGFFSNGTLVAVGLGGAMNVEPRETVYISVTNGEETETAVDEAKCRLATSP